MEEIIPCAAPRTDPEKIPVLPQPLDVATRLPCLFYERKGDKVVSTWRECEIIERAPYQYKDAGHYKYYIHYVEFNRRLDEWVTADRFDLQKVDQSGVHKDWEVGKVTRHQKRKHEEVHDEAHEGLDPQSLKEHEEATKVKNINQVVLGKNVIDTWYYSPFPAEYSNCDVLYFCEFCLKFVKRKEQLLRHMKKCDLRHPPGDEIYRNNNISVFEIDGAKRKIYCQNLCFLAKLFLDHKTLYYDVDPFLFYIIAECDNKGCHIVGYFSKEKHSEEDYNLACILTMPPYQRKGYGKFIIQFSYELSKKEMKVGTPERPLSDLGLVSYRSYWARELLLLLKKISSKGHAAISIKELSDATMFKTDDIINTLQHLHLIKYWKGQHIISLTEKQLNDGLAKYKKPSLPVDPAKLHWTPMKWDRY